MVKQPDKVNDHAVTLRYDGNGAPRVTAKGQGEVARRIRDLARDHDVPEYRSEELAPLLSRVDLGDEIPRELFVAVAEVIAFAYALRPRGTS